MYNAHGLRPVFMENALNFRRKPHAFIEVIHDLLKTVFAVYNGAKPHQKTIKWAIETSVHAHRMFTLANEYFITEAIIT